MQRAAVFLDLAARQAPCGRCLREPWTGGSQEDESERGWLDQGNTLAALGQAGRGDTGRDLTNASSIWGRSTGETRPGRRGWCHTSAHDTHGSRPVARPSSNAPTVNGDQVRDTWFWPPRYSVRGYDARQIQELFRRIAAELDAGRPVGPLIENATLRTRELGRQYDVDAVDWFLGQFLLPPGRFGPDGISADPWRDLLVTQLYHNPSQEASGACFVRQCANAWRNFGQLPGTHLWWGRAGMFRKALYTEEQQILASVWGSSLEIVSPKVSAGGRSFTFTSRARHHENPPKTWTRAQFGRWVGLVDETGIPVLYTNGNNFGGRASASIMFPDQRWLRFLVRGTQKANAIMTAVDQAGNRVARYRLADKRKTLFGLSSSVEIAVNPGWKLTDELALALVISAKWLQPYFARSG